MAERDKHRHKSRTIRESPPARPRRTDERKLKSSTVHSLERNDGHSLNGTRRESSSNRREKRRKRVSSTRAEVVPENRNERAIENSSGKWSEDDLPSRVPRNSGHGQEDARSNRSEQERGDRDPKIQNDKPNFGLSGKLLEDTNMHNGVVITYSQPPEARKPKVRWRFYPFKGTESLPTMYLHRQSAYLLGRDRRVVDIPLDHPSCSKQHAVIQYRLIPVEKEDGTVVRRVKPYIIDLNSGNGTFVNGKKIEPERFIELLEKDVVKFGFSSREYVMLHEGSKDDEYHSGDDLSTEDDEKK